jgi:membrane protease YdiL (CAAX protease family)
VSRVAAVAGNAAAAEVAAMDATGLLLFLGRTFIQLIGEEVITILPLLAALWFCVQRLNLSRRAGLVVAVLVSTLLFGALHLPTYDWNLVQCFVIIGSARLMLTLAYIVSRNLWVSAGAHIINDWSIFLITYAGNHLPIGS